MQLQTKDMMPNQHKFVTLDALRGVAAILVLTRHTSLYWGEMSFHHAYLAVDLFFMLSGFVISHAYDKRLIAYDMKLSGFVLTRLIRLYPLYLLALITSALVFFPKKNFFSGDTGIGYDFLVSLFFSLFYFPYKVDGSGSLFYINGVSWSLFFELLINFFYVLFRPFLSIKILVFVVIVTGLYLGGVAIYVGGLDFGYLWDLQSILIGSARTIYGFFFGLLLHRLFLKYGMAKTSTIKSFLIVLLASFFLGFQNINALNGFVDCFSILFAFPVFVFLGAIFIPKNKLLYVFEVLGIVSYPLYLLHDSVGAGIAKMLMLVGMNVKQFAPYGGFILIVILFVVCLFLDRFYDRPVRRYLSAIVFRRSIGDKVRN
ncbi:acyltransferase family protein [Methylomonas sp. 2BW1-5-20]|uniref:acyltransferase family protein n=1 Tax=Methylomonas sp. 2BW1-5-20 TaxID=3376686 RepID=UPI00404BAC6F